MVLIKTRTRNQAESNGKKLMEDKHLGFLGTVNPNPYRALTPTPSSLWLNHNPKTLIS